MRISNFIGLTIWFMFAKYLPNSTFPVIGFFAKRIRTICAKLIFFEIGKKINLESGAYFGNGAEIKIGDYSGIGKNCWIPSNITIGNNVMMAEEVIILNQNHRFDNVEDYTIVAGKPANVIKNRI